MSWCWDLFSPFFCKEQFTNSYTCLAPIFIFIDFLTLFGLTIIRISYLLFFVILECVVYAQTGLEGPSCREGQARFPQAWRALGQVCWQHREKKKKKATTHDLIIWSRSKKESSWWLHFYYTELHITMNPMWDIYRI